MKCEQFCYQHFKIRFYYENAMLLIGILQKCIPHCSINNNLPFFKWWLGTKQVTSHYLHQWLSSSPMHIILNNADKKFAYFPVTILTLCNWRKYCLYMCVYMSWKSQCYTSLIWIDLAEFGVCDIKGRFRISFWLKLKYYAKYLVSLWQYIKELPMI